MLKPLRRIAATLAAMAQSRIELASVEISETVERSIVSLVLAFIGLLLIAAAGLALSVLLVLLAGEEHRIQVLAVMTLGYLGAGVWLLLNVRERMRSAPALLAATMAELQHDARSFGKES